MTVYTWREKSKRDGKYGLDFLMECDSLEEIEEIRRNIEYYIHERNDAVYNNKVFDNKEMKQC